LQSLCLKNVELRLREDFDFRFPVHELYRVLSSGALSGGNPLVGFWVFLDCVHNAMRHDVHRAELGALWRCRENLSRQCHNQPRDT
jgi:hypothetical protein